MMRGTQSPRPFKTWGAIIATDAGLGRTITRCPTAGLGLTLPFGAMDQVERFKYMWIWVRS